MHAATASTTRARAAAAAAARRRPARLASRVARRRDARSSTSSTPRAANANHSHDDAPTSAPGWAYDTLGVDVTASKRAIRVAYRALSKDAHPDARGGSEAKFERLKAAADALTDDDQRAAIDASILDCALDSLTMQELTWSRALAALAEAEEDGEVRGADAVLAAARAYAAAERALERIAAQKKREKETAQIAKKEAALASATAKRAEVAKRVSTTLNGTDASVPLTITREMLRDAETTETVDGHVVRTFVVDAETESNCAKCDGWGEKEGHWTPALDKLCPRCDGKGRVIKKKKVRVPVRDGVRDGEVITVFGEGDGGFTRPKVSRGGVPHTGSHTTPFAW